MFESLIKQIKCFVIGIFYWWTLSRSHRRTLRYSITELGWILNETIFKKYFSAIRANRRFHWRIRVISELQVADPTGCRLNFPLSSRGENPLTCEQHQREIRLSRSISDQFETVEPPVRSVSFKNETFSRPDTLCRVQRCRSWSLAHRLARYLAKYPSLSALLDTFRYLKSVLNLSNCRTAGCTYKCEPKTRCVGLVCEDCRYECNRNDRPSHALPGGWVRYFFKKI